MTTEDQRKALPYLDEGTISQSSKGLNRRLVFHDFDYIDPKSRMPRGGLADYEMSNRKPSKNTVSVSSFQPAFHLKKPSKLLPSIKGSLSRSKAKLGRNNAFGLQDDFSLDSHGLADPLGGRMGIAPTTVYSPSLRGDDEPEVFSSTSRSPRRFGKKRRSNEASRTDLRAMRSLDPRFSNIDENVRAARKRVKEKRDKEKS